MTWITAIDETEASGDLHEAYDKVRFSRGRVSNIFRAHSLNPKAMKAHIDLYLSIMFEQQGLTRRQREMVAVLVSSLKMSVLCGASLRRPRPVCHPAWFLGTIAN